MSFRASTITISGFSPNFSITSPKARCSPIFVAFKMFIWSISFSETIPTPHAKASSVILSYNISLLFSVTFFESFTHSILESLGITTAPTTTGPANGPLPASSIPHMYFIFFSLYNFSSSAFNMFSASPSSFPFFSFIFYHLFYSENYFSSLIFSF